MKRGVVESLFDRAARVTSEQEDLHAEEELLRGALKMNSYPENFVERSIVPVQSSCEEEEGEDLTIPCIRIWFGIP